MKTTTTFKAIAIAAATALAAVISVSVLAQSGPGAGPGAGMGMRSGAGAGPMASGVSGMRGMRFDKSNTPGWTLMTTQERSANRTKMLAVKTYDECKALQAGQHAAMQARATEKGITLNAPKQNACDLAKARGRIN